MRASPRCLKIAPIRTVPVPIVTAQNLTDSGTRDTASTETQRCLRHAQRLEHFLAQEIPKRRSRNSLDNLSGEQHSHALILHLCAWLKQQRRLARARDE